VSNGFIIQYSGLLANIIKAPLPYKQMAIVFFLEKVFRIETLNISLLTQLSSVFLGAMTMNRTPFALNPTRLKLNSRNHKNHSFGATTFSIMVLSIMVLSIGSR